MCVCTGQRLEIKLSTSVWTHSLNQSANTDVFTSEVRASRGLISKIDEQQRTYDTLSFGIGTHCVRGKIKEASGRPQWRPSG